MEVDPAAVDRELDSILPRLERHFDEGNYRVTVATATSIESPDYRIGDVLQKMFNAGPINYAMDEWRVVIDTEDQFYFRYEFKVKEDYGYG